jgi:hypothetical protein
VSSRILPYRRTNDKREQIPLKKYRDSKEDTFPQETELGIRVLNTYFEIKKNKERTSQS